MTADGQKLKQFKGTYHKAVYGNKYNVFRGI
jgi:hypothetical protein